ncbi:MAG: hypothetical protein WAM90_02485 [Rhodanobacter sp.]
MENEGPHNEGVQSFLNNLRAALASDQALRHKWIRAKSKDFLDFTRSFVSGLTLIAGSLATTPYYACGDHWWRLIVTLGLGLSGLGVCYAAIASWSLTFRLRIAQLVSRRGLMVVLIVMFFFFFDISVWGAWKEREQISHRNPNSTIFTWLANH